jgi:hypothetical protein
MSAVRSVPTVKEDVAVTVHSRLILAAAVGLSFGQVFGAEEPAKLQVDKGKPLATHDASANQKTADAIVEQLRQSVALRGYKIDVVFQNKTAELSGCVGNMMQHDEALRVARTVPGVDQVRDQLLVLGGLKQTQAAMPPVPEAVPVPRRGAADGAAPAPVPGPVPGPGFPGGAEPVPIFQAGAGPAGPPYSLTPPSMPPYAWPTYAAYNNYSRVAYPQAYPYTAWPFIGPPYPFPKVPLGWRAVQLEWVDGHWWFMKYAHCYDYWRLRYW